MAILDDLQAAVVLITDRPDLVAETQAMLRRSLQEAHNASRWNFDIASIIIPNPGVGSFTFSFPDRFKAVANIRSERFQVKLITPEALFDDFVMFDRTNTYYIAGQALQFSILDPYKDLCFEYYKYPTFEDSFIVQKHVDYIVQLAAAKVFKLIKAFDLADRWEALAKECYVELERLHYHF